MIAEKFKKLDPVLQVVIGRGLTQPAWIALLTEVIEVHRQRLEQLDPTMPPQELVAQYKAIRAELALVKDLRQLSINIAAGAENASSVTVVAGN